MKLKEKAKYAAAAAAPLLMTGLATITSYADEVVTYGDSDSDSGTSITSSVTTSLMTAVTEIASSIGDVIGKIIPIALPLIGAGLVVTVGLKIFKKVTSHA